MRERCDFFFYYCTYIVCSRQVELAKASQSLPQHAKSFAYFLVSSHKLYTHTKVEMPSSRYGEMNKVRCVKRHGSIDHVIVNGVEYRQNDFCFVRPDKVVEPYYIASIMGFQVDKVTKKVKVQLGWYLRPHDKDVASLRKRKIRDSRYIFATMHTDTVPARLLTSRCTVEHEQCIDDLEAYIKQENCFYYNQLYDKYNRKFYDVVPLRNVKALPRVTMERLAKYSFLVVDDGTANYYTHDRTCDFCQEQCAINDGLTCSTCHKTFHMACVGATTRPRVGFAWECAGCTLERDIVQGVCNPDDAEVQELQTRLKKRSRKSAVYYHSRIKPTAENGWPFRYYHENMPLGGQAYDADFDKGLPRAFTRLGRKFQVPYMPECRPKSKLCDSEDEEEKLMLASLDVAGKPSRRKYQSLGSLNGNGVGTKKMPLPETRRVEPYKRSYRGSKAELVLKVPQAEEAKVDAYFNSAKAHFGQRLCSTDQLDFILSALARADYNTDVALDAVKSAKNEGRALKDWTSEDVAFFESEIFSRNYDLASFKDDLVDKTLGDITNFFFVWKKTDRKRQLKREYQQFALPSLEKVHDGAISSKDHPTESNQGPDTGGVDSSDCADSDSDSDCGFDPLAEKIKDCTLCCSQSAKRLQTVLMVWGTYFLQYKHEVLCEECLDYFKRYGLPVPLEEIVKRNISKRKVQDFQQARKERLGTVKKLKKPHNVIERHDQTPLADASLVKGSNQSPFLESVNETVEGSRPNSVKPIKISLKFSR